MVLGVRRPDTSARACHDQYAVTSTHSSTCLQISQVWMTCTLKYYDFFKRLRDFTGACSDSWGDPPSWWFRSQSADMCVVLWTRMHNLLVALSTSQCQAVSLEYYCYVTRMSQEHDVSRDQWFGAQRLRISGGSIQTRYAFELLQHVAAPLGSGISTKSGHMTSQHRAFAAGYCNGPVLFGSWEPGLLVGVAETYFLQPDGATS